MKRAIFAAIAVAAATGLVAPSGLAQAAANKPAVVYDATYSTLPGNVPSEGFAATSTSELGDEVVLDGTARKLNTVTITLSSWACERGAWNTGNCISGKGATYDMPLTLTLYNQSSMNDDGTVTPGSVITRTTQTIAMPYRPTASLKQCKNGDAGKWYSKPDGTCYNGKAFNVTLSFKSLKLALPDDVVVGVAFNTTNSGYTPYGTQPCTTADGGCFYDSLNVAVSGDSPSVGHEKYDDTIFQNTTNAGELCDSTPTLGVFNLNSPTSACWAGYQPNIKIAATN